MIRSCALILAVAMLVFWQAPTRASGDFYEPPAWKLAHPWFSGVDNMALIGPGNDTRANLLLFLFDLRGKAPTVSGAQDPMHDWASMKDLFYPRPEGADSGYAEGEGSRCRSNGDGITAFETAVGTARVSADERTALIAARRALQPNCASQTDDAAMTAALANLKSAEAKAFGRYLQGARAFYDGDFDGAAAQFGALKNASQPWLKETACYMLGRVEVNRAQVGAYDEYGFPRNFDKIDHKVINAAASGLNAYVQQFPKGQYAASARGLLRRVYWLGQDSGRLSALYAAMMAQPAAARGIDDVALAEEIDSKLLGTIKPEAVGDPVLLAVSDLQRMRKTGGDEASAQLAIGELQAQRPKFASNPALFDYLLATHAFYVANNPREVMRLIPDASHQASFSYLQFSRQTLRGMALDAVKDRNARGFWLDLMAGAKSPLQRPALELALAYHDEWSGGIAKVFAADSPVKNRAIRDILLMNIAGPALLRQQARDAGATKHERQLALFTLLYKDLTRGGYQGFLDDLALVPPHASAEFNGYDLRGSDEIGVGLFAQSTNLGDYGCPALKETATQLLRAPKAPKYLLCLAEFMRVNGFDQFVLDADKRVSSYTGEKRTPDELGDSKPEFPGGLYSRLEVYKGVLANPASSANDKAYALYRAINCYGPSGNNSCGGVEVPEPQRKAWFTRLKKEFGTTEWARDQKYYW